MKRKVDNTSARMKAAGMSGGVSMRRKGEWEKVVRPEAKKIPGKAKPKKDKHKTDALALSTPTLVAMAKDKASGMTEKQMAVKYAVSARYVHEAMKTLFTATSTGREVLKNVLLDNAIATGMRVRATVDELSPMQSVIATGIMTQRFVDLEKHTQAAPPDVDFSELSQMGNLLRNIRESVGLDDDSHGPIIDIEAESQVD